MSTEIIKFLRAKSHEDLRSHLNAIYDYVTEVEEERDKAREQVKLWNKDEEIQKLKTENETLRRREYTSFVITPEEREFINNWKAAHVAESPNCGGYKGPIGGNWSYEFTPTSIGDLGIIKCSCGAEVIFKELS